MSPGAGLQIWWIWPRRDWPAAGLRVWPLAVDFAGLPAGGLRSALGRMPAELESLWMWSPACGLGERFSSGAPSGAPLLAGRWGRVRLRLAVGRGGRRWRAAPRRRR